MAKEMPKLGDRIPAEKFHVSKMNVRAGDPFGESDEDKLLINQLRRRKIIGPFKARSEDGGYGVYVGRRRFLAKKEAGGKHFVVGADCLIEEVSDEEAREASLIENLEVLRREMNPITRAKALNAIIAQSTTGLRGTAGRLRLSPSTLSEWLKVLDLSPKMQEAVSKGDIFYTDALEVARMKLGEELQNELATVAKNEGKEAFKKAVERIPTGKMKRGIKAGTYLILRVPFDKRSKPDMELYEALTKLAEAKEMEIDEYNKWVLREHVKSAA